MKKNELRSKWIFMSIAIMLLVVSCLGFTGAWFTDKEDIEGEGTEPIIQPVLYDYTSLGQLVDLDSYYFTPTVGNLTDTSKNVVVKFTADTNVTKLLLRVIVNVTWGSFNDLVFEEDSEVTANSYSALLPDYGLAWSKGYIYLDGISNLELYTEQEIEEYFTGNMSTYFYFNDVITSPTSAQISIYDTLIFDTSYNALLNKTAKITVSVEAKDATVQTTGELEEADGVWTLSVFGKWTPAADEDRPTILWIQTVQSDNDFMQ